MGRHFQECSYQVSDTYYIFFYCWAHFYAFVSFTFKDVNCCFLICFDCSWNEMQIADGMLWDFESVCRYVASRLPWSSGQDELHLCSITATHGSSATPVANVQPMGCLCCWPGTHCWQFERSECQQRQQTFENTVHLRFYENTLYKFTTYLLTFKSCTVQLLRYWSHCLSAVMWYWQASTMKVSPTGRPKCRGTGTQWVSAPSVTLLVSYLQYLPFITWHSSYQFCVFHISCRVFNENCSRWL